MGGRKHVHIINIVMARSDHVKLPMDQDCTIASIVTALHGGELRLRLRIQEVVSSFDSLIVLPGDIQTPHVASMYLQDSVTYPVIQNTDARA